MHWISHYYKKIQILVLEKYGFQADCTKGCIGEQASLEFDLTFGDVLLHKLVQAYEHSKSNNFYNCKNLKFEKDHCV